MQKDRLSNTIAEIDEYDWDIKYQYVLDQQQALRDIRDISDKATNTIFNHATQPKIEIKTSVIENDQNKIIEKKKQEYSSRKV